jgi:hypothetical protein
MARGKGLFLVVLALENVGSQFLSLRQAVRRKFSPVRFDVVRKASFRGALPINLWTPETAASVAGVLSKANFSQPLDCGDLVRIS